MNPESRRPSGERYREKLKARHALALLKLHRGLAERCEREASPSLRAEYAARYKEVVGVEPDQRDEFRAALGRIEAGGGMPVQDVIDLLRLRCQANGFASGGEGGENASLRG